MNAFNAENAQNRPLSSVILGVSHSYNQLTDYVFQKKIKLPDCNILNEYHVYEIAPK